MENERTELIKRIQQAFKSVPFPNRKIGDKEELQRFLGKKRQDITMDDINRVDSLLYFNHSGLQYYLPAYLLAVLEHPDKVNDDAKRSLLVDLVDYDASTRNQLCSDFTLKQKQAVLDFFRLYESFFPFPPSEDLQTHLRYLADQRRNKRHEQIQEAIRYWENCL